MHVCTALVHATIFPESHHERLEKSLTLLKLFYCLQWIRVHETLELHDDHDGFVKPVKR